MARHLALVAALTLALAGCAAAPDAAPPTVTETTTVTATPEPTVTATPEPTPTRDEAAFLYQLSNYDEFDTATKLAIGNQACDELEANVPLDELAMHDYVTAMSETGWATNLGLAVRALCPDAIPDAA